MAKANGVETAKTTKDQWKWNHPFSRWFVLSQCLTSLTSAVRLHDRIRDRHGILSIILTGLLVLCGPAALWERRRRRIRRERGIPDPDPIREGRYITSLLWPVLGLWFASMIASFATGSVFAWSVFGVSCIGLIHLIGTSAVAGSESLTIRNGQFRRRRTIPYAEIASLRMIHPSYPFTGSRVLEIGLRGGETLRVPAISDDRIGRSDVWARTVPSAEQRKVAPAPMLGKIREHTGLPIQTHGL